MAVIRRKVADDLVDDAGQAFAEGASGGRGSTSMDAVEKNTADKKGGGKEVKGLLTGKPLGSKEKKILMICPILIIVVFVLVKVLSGLLGGSKLDYFSTFPSLFTNELGTFRYVFSINTGEAGTLHVETSPEIVEEDGGLQFSDWNKYSDVAITEWKYPVYQVILEGYTTSVDPLETYVKVTLSTPYYGDVFTELTCFQGSYYINIDQMRSWLTASKDEYLMEIGSQLPQGSKYLVIPESDFKFPSRYAEDTESGASEVTGLVTMYRRDVDLFQALFGNIISGIGTQSGTENTAMWHIDGEDGIQVMKNLRSVLLRVDSLMESLSGSNYDEAQQKQRLNERDNIMDAVSGILHEIVVSGVDNSGFVADGSVRTMENGYGNAQVEGTMSMFFTIGDVDYSLSFNGYRSGDYEDVTLPNGSQLTYDMFGGQSKLISVINPLFDYFNFTPIPLENKLAEDIDTLKDDTLAGLVRLLQASGEDVTDYTLASYMEAHINDTDGLFHDFIEEFNGLTGGLIVEREVQQEEVIDQYPEIFFSERGIEFTIKYNSELSNTSMLVLDGEAINKYGEAVSVDLTQFSVRTLLDSMYPANNETLLIGANEAFDLETLQTSLDLPEKSWGSFRLYFVLSDDRGHMDLYLVNDKVGVAIEF